MADIFGDISFIIFHPVVFLSPAQAKFSICCVAMFPQASKKASNKRQRGGQKACSNVFSMFEQSQIQEFKEVHDTNQIKIRLGLLQMQSVCIVLETYQLVKY